MPGHCVLQAFGMAPLLLALVLLMTAARAQTPGAGNATERLELCTEYALPAQYVQYLDTSFVGGRQHIVAGSVNYSYYQFGPLLVQTGRPLVLIAGQGATASVWTPDLLQPLAQGRQVTIFDNRGIGLSLDESADNYTIDSFADSTIDLIQALGLQQPDVVGWSMGGIVGLELATRFGVSIGSLVLADTTLGGDLFDKTPAGQEEALAFSYVEPFVAAGVTIPATNIFPDTAVGNDAMCRFLNLTAAMPEDKATQAQNLRQAGALLDFHGSGDGAQAVYERLGNVTSPVLIIAGQQDHVDPVAGDLALLDAIPEAAIVEIADSAAHHRHQCPANGHVVATQRLSQVTFGHSRHYSLTCLKNGSWWLQFADAGHAAILQHSTACAALVAAFLDDQQLPSSSHRYMVEPSG